ncbi:hypothetical protein ZHAS_00012254 [Anopheles sinensis]|uniref:Uncharacterized protein n=1 Tax=Anopheles sinensis TaxID=74873 RepID=A0A084W2M2_ANOSI|nr:hypothetical protein ZHAS_00012254 [Anopheles sinensis]
MERINGERKPVSSSRNKELIERPTEEVRRSDSGWLSSYSSCIRLDSFEAWHPDATSLTVGIGHGLATCRSILKTNLSGNYSTRLAEPGEPFIPAAPFESVTAKTGISP